MTIKVKRSGIARLFSKSHFRSWLDEQPRNALTYNGKNGAFAAGTKGWATEDFWLEAKKRGVDLRIMTIYKWASGSVPRYTTKQILEEKFIGIKF